MYGTVCDGWLGNNRDGDTEGRKGKGNDDNRIGDESDRRAGKRVVEWAGGSSPRSSCEVSARRRVIDSVVTGGTAGGGCRADGADLLHGGDGL